MSKRKRNNLTDLLGQILTEIGLYDELYDFMKCKPTHAYDIFIKINYIVSIFFY